MFSGIVEESAVVLAFERMDGTVRLVVASALDHGTTALGDSIAIDGACLTVVRKEVEGDHTLLSFDLLEETMRRTTFGDRKVDDRVNLERSLALGERLHGHFVFGHVDATITLRARTPDGTCDRLEWSYEGSEGSLDLGRHLASKGSVSISGTSLTVGEVGPGWFSVYIIPHTAEVTTLGRLPVGGRANLEVDMLARYVVAALSEREIRA